MTSAQTMRRLCVSALAVIPLGACTARDPLAPPLALSSPYQARQVWAIAPFLNESGVSIVAGDRVADAFVHEAQHIDGIDTIAVNRVIAAMRQLNMPAVTSPAQARVLLRTLGADALIVGTVTAYDPYQPPKFGASIALFTNDFSPIATLDPVRVTRSRTEEIAPGALPSNDPMAQAAGLFDAANHATLLMLQQYAAGRHEPSSAFGERIYQVRMALYTQFAAHRLLHDLLLSEQARLWPEIAAAEPNPPRIE